MKRGFFLAAVAGLLLFGVDVQRGRLPPVASACCLQPHDDRFMRLALGQARAALSLGEVPVGCVIVRAERVVSAGHNLANTRMDATCHAELVAVEKLAAESVGGSRRRLLEGCELYVTCEPCVMCAAALGMLGVERVVMGCCNPVFGGAGSVLSLHKDLLAPSMPGEDGKEQQEREHVRQRQEEEEEATVAQEEQQQQGRQVSLDRMRPSTAYLCVRGVQEKEAISLLRTFYALGNPRSPRPARSPHTPEPSPHAAIASRARVLRLRGSGDRELEQDSSAASVDRAGVMADVSKVLESAPALPTHACSLSLARALLPPPTPTLPPSLSLTVHGWCHVSQREEDAAWRHLASPSPSPSAPAGQGLQSAPGYSWREAGGANTRCACRKALSLSRVLLLSDLLSFSF